jgi:hypothetical protein
MDLPIEKLFENGVLASIIAVFLVGAWRLANRFVATNDKFLAGLETRELMQQGLCEKHAEAIRTVGSAVHESSDELCQLRQAALVHCRMCRQVIDSELPMLGSKIEPHLAEMERILNT